MSRMDALVSRKLVLEGNDRRARFGHLWVVHPEHVWFVTHGFSHCRCDHVWDGVADHDTQQPQRLENGDLRNALEALRVVQEDSS